MDNVSRPPKRSAAPAAAPAATPTRTPNINTGASDPLRIDTGGAEPLAAPRRAAPPRARKKQFDFLPKNFQLNPKIAAIAAAAVLLVVAVIWFATRSSGPGAALRYMPDGMSMLGVVHYDDMMSSRFMKSAIQEFDQIKSASKEFNKEVGDLADKIERITFGANTKNEAVAYVEFSSSVTASQIKKQWNPKAKYKYRTIKGNKVYTESSGNSKAFCLLDDNSLLIGDLNTLKKVLGRKGQPKLSKDMKSALASADMSKTICVAMSLKSKGAANGLPLPPPAAAPLDALTKSGESLLVGVDFGSDLDFDVTVVCEDSGDAKSLKKQADDGFEQAEGFAKMMLGKEGGEAVENFEVSQSGSTVSLTGGIDITLLKKIAEKSAQLQPPGRPF